MSSGRDSAGRASTATVTGGTDHRAIDGDGDKIGDTTDANDTAGAAGQGLDGGLLDEKGVELQDDAAASASASTSTSVGDETGPTEPRRRHRRRRRPEQREEETAAEFAERRNEDAFSSSSSSSGDEDDVDQDDEEEEHETDEEEESLGTDKDGEEEDFTSEDGSSPGSRQIQKQSLRKKRNSYGSEFDKALRSGQGPSRGNFLAESSSTEQTQTQQQLHHHQQQQHKPIQYPMAAPASSGGSTATHNSRAVAASNSSAAAPAGHPPPPPPNKKQTTAAAAATSVASSAASARMAIDPSVAAGSQQHSHPLLPPPPPPPPAEATAASVANDDDPLSSGVLPDVLMTMRQKIESLTLFDSDMMKLVSDPTSIEDPTLQETRESLKRSSQQSISAAVLVSLAHKRYERRRLAAMEIEKVVRSLVQQDELDRVRAILLLLSDDYVRSTSEDARKGGVVALAASAIGLKKAPDTSVIAHECRDLILASVVHACQDHSQRVRYYATESLFNVIKVIPSLAVQHFFILFEILRSLYADVDVDVKSGAELLDKKLKEVIVGAMNSGQFTAEACVPVFARFVYMRNKATKRLTLTWLQELTEKLIGAPILEFLHLFLTGIFDMIADPTLAIRQSALAFLQSVLPKLLDNHVVEEAIDDFQSAGIKVDFDKILQSLVTTMEHPDPFVRKIAMYWMSRIVKAHIGGENTSGNSSIGNKNRGGNGKTTTRDSGNRGIGRADASTDNLDGTEGDDIFHGIEDEDLLEDDPNPPLSAATVSVRNSLPHVLPGILLSIGDTFHSKSNVKDSFLPDTTTHVLAEQTNACLQQAVRKDGKAYVHHLDSFIVALREELDSPGGVNARNPPALERKPYRMDVKHDGTGIESQGWFRASNDTKEGNVDSMMMSRLCALHWIIVLYESVVPDVLKADYAREFIIPIIHQLVDNPPEKIIFKSLEVLAKITIPVEGESTFRNSIGSNSPVPPPPSWVPPDGTEEIDGSFYPMNDASIAYALEILDSSRRKQQSRDREVFSALIQLHAYNLHLVGDLSRVVAYMCRLQPPEFVFVSFAVELDHFVRREHLLQLETGASKHPTSQDYQFVSAFIQQMCLVLLNSFETAAVRNALRDCIGQGREAEEKDRRRSQLFHIMLHSFSHNLVAVTSLCLWGGACRTASLFLKKIDPLDINLVFLLELDKLVEMIERPLFRHLHVRMLEMDSDPLAEGSGTMLFLTLKCILMLIPQSTSYNVLRDRLVSTSRFRQSVIANNSHDDEQNLSKETEVFVLRVVTVRQMHCKAIWEAIRAESLESITNCRTKRNEAKDEEDGLREPGSDRREWLGYTSKDEELAAKIRYQDDKRRIQGTGVIIEELNGSYNDFSSLRSEGVMTFAHNTTPSMTPEPASIEVVTKAISGAPADVGESKSSEEETWKDFWSTQT